MTIVSPESGAATRLDIAFAGSRAHLFRLALWTGLLTVLTLGLYRFWMKTRLRRFYWSAVKPGGLPLEYTGEPLEKLLGFLIAVVFLAFYLGLVNLVLVFASFSLLQTNVWAYAVSFVGVIPLWFYAAYLARRYTLARTRWRGIRFGLEPSAWGYAWRAVGHWLVTLLSLGLLWPRMTFWLEKYRIDRTYFGTARLRQGGNVSMLWPAHVHYVIGVVFTGFTLLVALGEDNDRFLALLGVFVPWGLYGVVHYRVNARRLLAETKTAGALGLRARPQVGRVLRIYLLGGGLAFVLPLLIVGGIATLIAAGLVSANGDAWMDPYAAPGPVRTGQIVAALIAYFALFLIFGVLRHTLILLPLWRHYAETLSITAASALPTVGQRHHDTMEQAEGVAEALDVGAAI